MTHDGRRNLDVEYNVLNLPEKFVGKVDFGKLSLSFGWY